MLIRLVIAVSLALAVCGAPADDPTAGPDYVDDAALQQSFERELGDLLRRGEAPPAAAIRRQLRDRNHFAGTIPHRDAGRNRSLEPREIHRRAVEATLVLGHLYPCEECGERHANLAAGVLLSTDGLALTNHHVLAFPEAEAFGAMTRDGRVFAIESVLAASERVDVALVRLRGARDLKTVPLAEGCAVGDEVFVVSHPDAHFYSFSRGYVTRFALTAPGGLRRLQLSAGFARGSSGAGILDRNGALVGLAVSTTSIYYEQSGEAQRDLQMTVRSGVPLEAIRALFRPTQPTSTESPDTKKTLTAPPPASR